MLFYNIVIWLMVFGMKVLALFDRKAAAGVAGRKDIFSRLADAVGTDTRIVWIHCASLGEFEQGRPIIEAIKAERPEYKIMLTFFSPSGYEIRKDYPGADYVFYLPLDTANNAGRFVGIVRPEIAIFIKYEFWLNYLCRLREVKCRTFIVSAIFRKDSVFFRWYGKIFRKALRGFEKLFVQDTNSRELLSHIGIHNVIISGDTRFDRVAAVQSKAVEIPLVARFAKDHKTLVAGSTWPPDNELLIALARQHPEVRFVITPHEIGEERIEKLISLCPEGKAVRYTHIGEREEIPSGTQILVIDTIGILSSVYAYADFAYIGGGFGVGIHNTLEAAVYGIPLAFGPNYAKFREARELIEEGAAVSITDTAGLDKWLSSLLSDPSYLQATGKLAGNYVSSHTGATRTVLKEIFK